MFEPPLAPSVARAAACLVCLHERLQGLLVLLHWQMRGPLARELRRLRPGPASLLGHALAALLSTGCASLPPPEAARAPSTALEEVAHARLAQVARASAAGVDPALSGVRLRADGDQVSLDVQYYCINGSCRPKDRCDAQLAAQSVAFARMPHSSGVPGSTELSTFGNI
ncbi:hypothetical protein H4CHR_01816 [Variovorax sp. PBS-H4]|uniref:hypothetical protein n=1 Tax=Variovorax sp. PBS-H4 TaxID=434008 RepID=UPI00131756B3|nr:hypothetical protein [Variovorax sp. PBS-H4]VTU26544.1 hypothetical protein H4CHR_01816 [Variovorax sp. PBS-H4]